MNEQRVRKLSTAILSLIAGIFLIINEAAAQDPNISFSIEQPVCQGESISITNNSTDADIYEWDFCEGDLLETPSAVNSSLLPVNGVREIRYVEDGGQLYGFVVAFDSNSLIRLDFGASAKNDPAVVSFGNPGNLLNGPHGLQVINEAGQWYGLIINNRTNELVRISFGADITSTPTAELVNITPNILSGPLGLDLAVDDGMVYAITSNISSSTVGLFSFGNSITNDATGTSVALGVAPLLVTLASEGENWFAYVTSTKLQRLDFGTDLSNTSPTLTDITLSPNISNGSNINIVFDAGHYYGILSSAAATVFRLDFGTTLTNNSATVTDLGNLGVFGGQIIVGIEGIKEDSEHIFYGIEINSRTLKRVVFEKDCGVNQTISNDFAPSNINYNAQGTYDVTLFASQTGVSQEFSLTQQIVVSEDIAPDIDFTIENICVNNPANFSAVNNSGNIISFSWDFGDSNTSSDTNPTNTFAVAGDYDVSVDVVSAEGCENSIVKTITIFEEPNPSFSLPSGIICTNQSIFIENTTSDDFQGNITYEWLLNDVPVSNSVNLEDIRFTSTGTQEIKLIARIPGCEVETLQTISNVIEGPSLAFAVDDDCAGTLMQFNNNSTGQISSQTWNFGNGFTSDLLNPAFEYSLPGTYEVTLTGVNDQGCVAEVSEFVTVYELPQVQFTNELSCEQSPTQFIDQTVIGDANIVNWSWDFDDEASGNNTSIARDPQHTFSGSGNFNVKLVTTTTFGCVDSVEQIVSVLPGPEVDFSFDQVCIGEPIQFQDLSVPPTGGTITSWAWDLGGVFSDEQNPQFTFDVASEYRIGLVVTSDNLCSSFLEKIITVASPPDVSFEQEFACNNEPVHFYDVTEITNDRILEWNWNFDGLGQASDSSTFFMFPSEGNYNVSLNITTENGCNYSTSQMVEVNVAPNASFESDFTFGSPPLSVQFSNTSQGANSFLWDFDNGSTSTEESPQQVFDILDEYDVRLVANSAEGCRDTARQVISVLIPELEVELERVSLIPTGTSNNVVLTISNNGTLILDSLIAAIDLGNEVIVNETIKEKIFPGETINHTLNLSIGNNRLDYICIALESFLPNITDSNLNNNNRCEGLLRDAFILPPFPNPVSNEVTLSVVSGAPQMINVQLISNQGALVRDINVAIDEGFSNILIDVTDLNNGIYILNSSVGNTSNSVRVMVNN